MINPFYGTEQVTPREHMVFIPAGKPSKLKLLGAGGRKWQLVCFFKGCSKRFFWFSAYMGSGKSLEMLYLAVHELIKSGGTQKQVILFPYSFLQKGFKTCRLAFDTSGNPATSDTPKDEIREWVWNLESDRNLCASTITDSVVDSLIQAIVEPLDAYNNHWKEHDLWGRIVVTTDLALALAIEKMEKTPHLLEIAKGNHPDFGVTYNKDEAHRILMPGEDDEDEQSSLVGNKLGNFFSQVVGSIRGNLRMASGTFVRGDQKRTILGRFEGVFSDPYEQDFLEHYLTLGIEIFQMASYVYKIEPGMDGLFAFIREKLVAAKNEGKKVILIIPHENKGWRKEFDESTNFGATKLIILINEVYNDGVLDFFDEKGRDKKRDTLGEEPEDGDTQTKSKVQIAFGMDCLSIGVDWPECSVVINTVNDRSIIQLQQKPGRAFRKFHNKRKIEICNCIPEFQPNNLMSCQDVMVDFVNQIMAHFFMKDLFSPLEFTGMDGLQVRLRDYWREGGKYAKVCMGVIDKFKELELLESISKELDDHRLKPGMKVEDTYPFLEDVIQKFDPQFPEGELRKVVRAFVSRIISTRHCGLTKAKPSGGHDPKLMDTSNASFLREEGLNFIEDDTLLSSLGLFNTKHLNQEQLQQVRDVLQAHYQWDAGYYRAVEAFKTWPGVRSYLADKLTQNLPIEWVSWSDVLDKDPDKKKAVEWAVTQYRTSSLDPNEGARIRKMFIPEPRITTRLIPTAVQSKPRRSSW